MFGLVSEKAFEEFKEEMRREYENTRTVVIEAITEMVKGLEPGKNYILILPHTGDDEAEKVLAQLSAEYDLESDDIRFTVIFANDAKLLELT